MRLMKAFLTGAIGLFLVMTLLSLLIPSKVKVSRTTLINNTPAQKIFEQLSDLSQWKNWHPVFKSTNSELVVSKDSATGKQVGTVNFDGKTAKIRLQEVDPTTIKFVLQSPGENDIQNEIILTPIPGQNNVEVEWRAINRLKWYPWEKFYGIFIDKLTGTSYEQALKGLKDYLESGHK